jgi:O-methyltransferase
VDIETYFRSAAVETPTGYEGQLSDPFQEALRDYFSGLSADDCRFYHTMEFPDGTVHEGLWDLRGREKEYLGNFDFRGRRVLELGPATGYLTFWMERQGANVVSVDLPLFTAQPILPESASDIWNRNCTIVDSLRPVRNSWWFARSQFSSAAKCVYADIYNLPRDLGQFDVAVFGSVLLHLSRPFDALKEAAKLTDVAIIVSEPVPAIPISRLPLASFDPSGRSYVFWGLSPSAIAKMLKRLGFTHLSMNKHRQHRVDAAEKEKSYFTLIGRRQPNGEASYEGPTRLEILKNKLRSLISELR